MLAEADETKADIVIPISKDGQQEPLFAIYRKSALSAINKVARKKQNANPNTNPNISKPKTKQNTKPKKNLFNVFQKVWYYYDSIYYLLIYYKQRKYLWNKSKKWK